MCSDLPSAPIKRCNGKNEALPPPLIGDVKLSANGYFCPFSDAQPAPLGMTFKNDNLGSTNPAEQAASLSFRNVF